MEAKDSCSGWAGKIFGHNYKAVFEESQSDAGKFNLSGCTAAEALDILNATRTFAQEYVQTHCTRCGSIIGAGEAP